MQSSGYWVPTSRLAIFGTSVSRILGILSLNGKPVSHLALAGMMAPLVHRVADGSSQWAQETIGLGHQRLSSTTQSARETLPLKVEPGHVIVADARLDNRSDLIGALGIEPALAKDQGDGELICRAYIQWGTECPERLLGDFSFAIWDSNRRRLFCARDRFGVKPFYFHHGDRSAFAFGSELKSVLAAKLFPLRLNEKRVAQYLRSDLQDQEATFYQGVWRLPPAHSLTVSAEGIQCSRYWALDPFRELEPRADEDFEREFRERFLESVRVRVTSSGTMGAMLSGGLDSSSIVCAASRSLRRNDGGDLHSFSAIFDDVPESDEREFVLAVLAGRGIQAHFFRGDTMGPLTAQSGDFQTMEEPLYAPNLFLHRKIFEVAHSLGVRVVLDGFDGDIVVSHGLAHLRELAIAHRWLRLTQEVKASSERLQCSAWSLVRHQLLSSIAPAPFKAVWRHLKGADARDQFDPGILKRSFANRICGSGTRATKSSQPLRVPQDSRQAHFVDLSSGLIPLALEMADRAAAACGVEPRYPFFDSRLAEYCLALPSDQKLRDGWTRSILRRALKDLLPSEIYLRGSKTSLSPNFVRALLTFDRKFVDTILENDGSPVWEYANIATIRGAYKRLLRRGSDVDALQVWKAVTFGIWLERFLLM
jgi:asparagine synthase (glutamine-hydrolysing)